MNIKDQVMLNRKDIDPLLALAGTLRCDVRKIKNHIKSPNCPKMRVVKGAYEGHPEPLIALLGTLECSVTNIGERHDDYIGDALLMELCVNEDE